MIFLAVIIVLILPASIYIVPQQSAYIIERLGKYNRESHAGIHLRIPLIERIVAKIPLRTQQTQFKIDAKTKDNVTIDMVVAAQYHVAFDNGIEGDPHTGVYRSFYILNDPEEQMRSYLVDSLRSSVPNYDLDQVFENKDDIANKVNSDISQKMIVYGYFLVTTQIISIGLPKDVETAMNDINAAQRRKEAAQSLAEAEKIKLVTEAKAKAEAAEQAGIGIANQRKAIAQGIKDSLNVIQESGVDKDEANMLFLYTQWTDMMEEFAKHGNGSTVVLPSDFNQTSSMFEQIMVANKESHNIKISRQQPPQGQPVQPQQNR